MPATQMKISSFFGSSSSVKRPLVDSNSCNEAMKRASSHKSPSKSPKKPKSSTDEKLKLWEQKSSGLVCNLGPSWLPALSPEFEKPYFSQLCQFVAKERASATVYPEPANVFSWTQACKLKEVKVVILGQDPYHGPNQAHGLCFSVLPGVPAPPSLVNMYKELTTDIKGFKTPDHGYLMGWAQQGVLLLNAVLTVRKSCANSHKDQGWEKVTDAIIQYLNKNLSGLVFMLWGSYAQKKGAQINKKKHCVLASVHPSPLSAHRGFFGCKHFSKANDYLNNQGKPPIDWTTLPSKSE